MKYERISQEADEQEFMNSPEGRLLEQNGRRGAPTAAEIAERAYHIYLNDGAQPGHDWDHWLKAEAELNAERNLFPRQTSNVPESENNIEPMNNTATASKSAGASSSKAPASKSGVTSVKVKSANRSTESAAPVGANLSVAQNGGRTHSTGATKWGPTSWNPAAPDLTRQPPHSPSDRLAGFSIARRAIDKCRATLAGKQGEYHFDCPVDNMLFSFKGITGKEFQAAVQQSKSAEEVGLWLQSHGTSKTPAEIEAWSNSVEASSLGHDPAKRAFFKESCQKLGLNPDETSTFEWLDADDRATFAQPVGANR